MVKNSKKGVAEQQSLLTYVCAEDGHNFGVIGDGYYKRDSNQVPIKNKVFRVILCNKCGDTKEICVRDINDSNSNEKAKRKKKAL